MSFRFQWPTGKKAKMQVEMRLFQGGGFKVSHFSQKPDNGTKVVLNRSVPIFVLKEKKQILAKKF